MKICLLCNSQFEDEQIRCSNDGSRLVYSRSDGRVGTVLVNKYRIDGMVGKGSIGNVYKSLNVTNNQVIAVKILHSSLNSDAEALARFTREAKMLSILDHPNILSVIDYGETNSAEPFFVAEFLDGTTLTEVIAQRNFIPVSAALPIVRQICAGLIEAHSHGFIHRDIKPSNIMIMNLDEPQMQVKILDFSIAKPPAISVEERVTQEGMLRGSPAYMSPEQCNSMEVDLRSDIYSLVTVIFEMLTGSRPFSSKNSVITMHQQINQEPPYMVSLRSDLHFCSALENLVHRCLSKNPDDRPNSVEQFLDEFERACAEQQAEINLDVPMTSISVTEKPKANLDRKEDLTLQFDQSQVAAVAAPVSSTVAEVADNHVAVASKAEEPGITPLEILYHKYRLLILLVLIVLFISLSTWLVLFGFQFH